MLGPLWELLKEDGEVVCLIKPQFEAGREKVGKKGVVRDPKVHEEVFEMVTSFASANGYLVQGLTYSPIKGPEGNIEYLAWLKKREKGAEGNCPEGISELVAEAHGTLSQKAGV